MNGRCTNCGQACKAVIIDFGIGTYEFWGSREVDIQESAVSPCCEAPVTLNDGSLITVKQIKEAEQTFYAEF